MRKINRIFTYFIVAILCLSSKAFATTNEEEQTDCEIFAIARYHQQGKDDGFTGVNQVRGTDKNDYSKFLTVDQQLEIIDKESLNIAMLNLKKYCCKHGNELKINLNMQQPTCSDDEIFFNENSIDSPYLFDHLYDVIMRRYIGLTGENDIYPNMTVDEKGSERRARILEQAENLSGSNPQIIIDKYKEYRTPTEGYSNIIFSINTSFSKDNGVFLKYVSGNGGSPESEEIAEALKNYSKRTLADKYNRSLALTEYFYALLGASSHLKDKPNITDTNFKKYTDNGFNSELQYVQTIMQSSTNRYIINYTDSFLLYLTDRMEALRKTLKDSADKRLTITRSVSKLIPNCTK